MAASPLDGLYWDFHIPLNLKELLEGLMRKNNSPNVPEVVLKPTQQEWLSQPRISTDSTTEVIQTNFKLPLSISEIGFQALRVSCKVEVWYQDRQNNWRPALDKQRIPIALSLSTSEIVSWYKYHTSVYPIVAKAVQFRITRIADSALGNSPYCVGLKETLIRRNVYDRSDGNQAFEDEQDGLGNVISKYIKDWDAAKAIDDKPYTFWKSAPMPDPDAVCSLYLDTRNFDGSPQLADKIYIDPVYTHQNINIYYSNDDTVGTRKLSPRSLLPNGNSTVGMPQGEGTNWVAGKGLTDNAGIGFHSSYQFPLSVGPLVNQDCWIGIEWSPNFDGESGPAQNPILFEVTPNNTSGTQYWPKIYYDSGASEIVLKLYNGTTTKTYHAVISPLVKKNDTLRIVVGWKYDPDTVYISVVNKYGTEVSHVVNTNPNLPAYITLDGIAGFSYFKGTFTSHIVKYEKYDLTSPQFLSNPTVFVSPDPVVPDANGVIPSTTLDNAILAADWTTQQFATGGTHDSHYEDKEWTPIWKDYVSQKGNLILPKQISMKYLKLEFTNLTEEPYPVYDSGIETSYKVFPISVIQLAIKQNPNFFKQIGAALSLGWETLMGGIFGVNWMNASTVAKATNTLYGETVLPVQVNVGPGLVTGSLPNTAQVAISDSSRSEKSNPYIYRRQVMSPFTMVDNAVQLIKKSQPIQGIPTTVDDFWDAITSTSKDTKLTPANNGALPIQGKDWWIFPGQTLKMPASVMKGLTNSQTYTWGKKTLEARVRFPTQSVHRYDIKTLRRDAAIAYFAGVREVSILRTSYIAEQDPLNFNFSTYDSSQWVMNDIKKLDSGPITNSRHQYIIENPGFDTGIFYWDFTSGDWQWDSNPFLGHWMPGTLKTTGISQNQNITSSLVDVEPGWNFSASCFTKWTNLSSTSGAALQLRLITYLDGVEVGSHTLDEITYSDWTSHETSDWTELSGGWTIPSGVNGAKVCLTVTDKASSGTIWFDTVNVWSTDNTEATIYKNFITTSTFAKVKCEFSDSGVRKSDGMWAREDPFDTNISSTALAYYTKTIPENIPAGMWSDTFATWSSAETAWGEPNPVVAISVDPNRIYDGKRVLHFRRASQAEYGEVGIKVRQTTNFVPNGLFRINATFYKPIKNDNQIIVRLRRVSDGVYVYQETITKPPVGYWYNFTTHFQEIPDSPDQIYTVELVISGDDEDELYLSDLFCEVAQIRYFVQLGGSDQFLHDVTELAYANSNIANVTCTTPVNEVTVQAAILSDRAFAYGMKLTPDYLK